MPTNGITIERIAANGTRTIYDVRESSPGSGLFDVVQLSEVSGKTPAAFGIRQRIPYTLSSSTGSAFRAQGMAVPPRQPGDNRVYLATNRIRPTIDGSRNETVELLMAKGATHTRAQHYPGPGPDGTPGESDYVAGATSRRWFFYGNMGTNSGDKQYDHRPWMALTDDIQTMGNWQFLNTKTFNLPGNPATQQVDWVIGNFEYFFWTDTLYNQAPNKDQVFLSHLDGQYRTIRDIYVGAGGGQNGINALNLHLHAKVRDFHALWEAMIRVRSNNTVRVANGDDIYMQRLHANGDLNLGGVVYPVTQYRTLGYDQLRQMADNTGVPFYAQTLSNKYVTINGREYRLDGHKYTGRDFLVQYLYYMDEEIRMRQSDYALLQSSSTYNTVDAWCSRMLVAATSIYTIPVTHAVRTRFFNLHKIATSGVEDFNALPVLGQWEKMIEGNYIGIIPDVDDEVNANSIAQGDPFMRWVDTATGKPDQQKHLLPRQVIQSRIWQEQLLFSRTGTRAQQGGTHEWWEGDPEGVGTGDMALDYTQGKYAHFHDRVIEWAQQALDQLNRYSHLFGDNSQVKYEDIPFQWRRGNFTNPEEGWSPWITNGDPAQACFNRVNGQRIPLPYFVELSKGGESVTLLQVAQAETGPLSTMQVRWKTMAGTINEATLQTTLVGTHAQLVGFSRAVGTTTPSGTYANVSGSYNTLTPLA